MSIEQQKSLLNRINPFLFFGVLFFGSLYLAKSFLVPVSIALLLALLMVPVSRKLEKKGMSRS